MAHLPRRAGVASWDRKGVALDRLSPATVTLYIDGMAKAQPTSTSTTVRDSKTGRFLTVRGVGALKGQLTLKKGVDLTKPIASQAIKSRKPRKVAAPKTA